MNIEKEMRHWRQRARMFEADKMELMKEVSCFKREFKPEDVDKPREKVWERLERFVREQEAITDNGDPETREGRTQIINALKDILIMPTLEREELEKLLVVGAKVKIGLNYCNNRISFTPGEIITLVEGEFDYENGLYTETQTAPSIWDEQSKDFESIYHLFGNDLEDFEDCEVLQDSTSNRH